MFITPSSADDTDTKYKDMRLSTDDSYTRYDGMPFEEFWPENMQFRSEDPDWAALVDQIHEVSYTNHPGLMFTEELFSSLSGACCSTDAALKALARRFPAGLLRLNEGKTGPIISLIDPEMFNVKMGRNTLRPAFNRLNTKSKLHFPRWRESWLTAIHDARWYAAAFCWLFKKTCGSAFNCAQLIEKMSTQQWLMLLPSLHNQILMITEIQQLEKTDAPPSTAVLHRSIKQTDYNIDSFGILTTAALQLSEEFMDEEESHLPSAEIVPSTEVPENSPQLEGTMLTVCAQLLLDRLLEIPEHLLLNESPSTEQDPGRSTFADQVLMEFYNQRKGTMNPGEAGVLLVGLVQLKSMYAARSGPSLLQIVQMIHALQGLSVEE